MNSQEYYLNIRPGDGYPQTVKVSQGDVGRPLLFHLMDGVNPLSIPAGATITIHGTKPSGLGFTETCTVSGSSAAISTTLAITQEYGLFPAELVVSANNDIIATANFSLYVERNPHPDGTTDGTKEELDDLYTEVANLKEDIENISGISDDVKAALLQIAAKAVYVDDGGPQYYQDLYDALYPPATLVSISAVYTQSGTVYDTDTLDSLKADLVVTAHYDDSTTATVTTYTLSGTLTEGTSTITVSYGGKTTTFTVEVTHQELPTGYTKYDYITPNVSFGTQTKAYGIWTDAQLGTDYTIEIKLKFPSDLGSNLQAQPIIGTRSSGSGTKEIALFFKYGQGTLGYWYSGTDSTTSITLSKGTVHTIKIQPVGVSQTYSGYATFDIDGTEYSTGSQATGVTFDSWFGIFTYAINGNGGISSGDVIYIGQQIGEILVTDSNGDAVYDFVPAKDSDGKYGFYEKVNGEFYYNSTYASTGFTGGDWT